MSESATWKCPACARTWPASVPLCPGDGELAQHERVGAYLLEARVGSNATGEQFRAVNERSGERVVLKVLQPGVDLQPSFVAQPLTHEHLVTLREVGRRADGSMWMVTDLLPGTTLREVMVGAPFAPYLVADIGRQIAEALHFLHGRNLAHGDLRAGTTHVHEEDGGALHVRLGEFGLTSRDGSPVSAPAYRAPELWGGARPSAASDVYALGCILYELSSGHLPFERDFARAHASDTLPSLPHAEGGAHALQEVVSSCAMKNPDDRPTAAALVERLTALATALAPPPPRRRDPTLTGMPAPGSARVSSHGARVDDDRPLPSESAIQRRLDVPWIGDAGKVKPSLAATQMAATLRQAVMCARELDRLVTDEPGVDGSRVLDLLKALALASQQFELWHKQTHS